MPSAHRYLINFLLDATLGMLLIYAGVRAVSVLVEWQQWESLRFGEYGEVLQTQAGGASRRGLCAVPTQPSTRVQGFTAQAPTGWQEAGDTLDQGAATACSSSARGHGQSHL